MLESNLGRLESDLERARESHGNTLAERALLEGAEGRARAARQGSFEQAEALLTVRREADRLRLQLAEARGTEEALRYAYIYVYIYIYIYEYIYICGFIYV